MVYFITAEHKFVKIGVSNTPELRLKELQTGNPFKLKLKFTMPGSFDTEKGFHDVFSYIRKSGEWFLYTGLLKSCLYASNDQNRKHLEVKTIKHFLENGIHFHLRQKRNNSSAFRNELIKYNIY